MFARLSVLGLALGMACPAIHLSAENTKVEGGALTFKISGTAHGPNVLLKDVILEALPEPMASMAVKPAGKPGGQVNVNLPLVQLKLKAFGKLAWTLSGPSVCQMTVPVQKISGDQFQHFAGDFLAAQLSGTAGATYEAKNKPQDLNTYDAPTRFKIFPGNQDWRGNVVLRVQILQPGVNGEDREVASVPVSFLVHRKEPSVYSNKALRKGDALDAKALVLHDTDTTFIQGQGFSSFEELAGKRARAYIGPGKMITADLVEMPPLIRRGDIVRLLVKSGGILIETQGKALRDARKGESLALELEGSKNQVQARCVDVGVAVREAY